MRLCYFIASTHSTSFDNTSFMSQAAALHGQKVDMKRASVPKDGFDMSWKLILTDMEDKAEKSSAEISAVKIPPSPLAIKEAKKWHESFLPSFGSSKVGVIKEPLDELPPKGSLSPKPKYRSKSRVYVENLVSLEDMAKMPSGLSADELAILDDLEKKLMTMSTEESSDLLMRSMPAGRVASHWHEVEHLQDTSAFWQANNGTQEHYKLRYTTHPQVSLYMTSFSFITVSEPSKIADCFVTHSWMLPSDWEVKPSKLAFSFYYSSLRTPSSSLRSCLVKNLITGKPSQQS
jgi:hypothetical protein